MSTEKSCTAVVQSVRSIDFTNLEMGVCHPFPEEVTTSSVRCVSQPHFTDNPPINRTFSDGVYMGKTEDGYHRFIGRKINTYGNHKGTKNNRKYHFLLREGN